MAFYRYYQPVRGDNLPDPKGPLSIAILLPESNKQVQEGANVNAPLLHDDVCCAMQSCSLALLHTAMVQNPIYHIISYHYYSSAPCAIAH